MFTKEGDLRLRRQAPHPARRSRLASTRGGPVARGARGLCHDGRGPRGRRLRPNPPRGTGLRAAASQRDVKAALNNYHSPVCVHPVQARLNACPQPAGACIVLPRAAPQ